MFLQATIKMITYSFTRSYVADYLKTSSWYILVLTVLFSLITGALYLSSYSYAQSMASTSAQPFVNIVVAYTPSARQGAGGTQAIKTLIESSVKQMNNSFPEQQFRIVDTIELAYRESGDMGHDLDYLQHQLNELKNIQIVSLWVETDNTDVCGLGYLAPRAEHHLVYNVVKRHCAHDNLTLGTELLTAS